jgi:isocitrate dehydrogenase
MFEAIHGSAPDIAGQNIANPSGLLQAAVMMLVHIGQPGVAERIHNAWLKTLEDGIHTPDIYHPDRSQKKVGTDVFTAAVIERLGEQPEQLQPANYPKESPKMNVYLKYSRGAEKPSNSEKRELKGIDVFVYWEPDEPEKLAHILKKGTNGKFELTMFTNRGTKVWPNGVDETFCTDHWRCRFQSTNGGVKQKDLLTLLKGLDEQNVDIIKTENLYEFNGVRSYSLGQGE